MASEALVKLSRSVTGGGQTVGGVDEVIACDYVQTYKQLVPNQSTDWELDIPITIANIYVSAIHASQNISVSCNQLLASTVAHQTIPVTKNVGLIYTYNQPSAARTFTADITKLYFTNNSGADALVQLTVGGKQAPSGTA